jgi:hypothetical protein
VDERHDPVAGHAPLGHLTGLQFLAEHRLDRVPAQSGDGSEAGFSHVSEPILSRQAGFLDNLAGADTGAGITLAFHAAAVYLDVGGTGTLTVSSGGKSTVTKVSGAPDIYTVATEQPAADAVVSIRLSPGLQAYSFTFG